MSGFDAPLEVGQVRKGEAELGLRVLDGDGTAVGAGGGARGRCAAGEGSGDEQRESGADAQRASFSVASALPSSFAGGVMASV